MHLGMSLGNISFPRYEQDFRLNDLNPTHVYSLVDLMSTGNDIVKLRKGSGGSATTQDFTDAELNGQELLTFADPQAVSSFVDTLYDQAGSVNIGSDTLDNQPSYRHSSKSAYFTLGDLLFSSEITGKLDNDYTIATKFDVDYDPSTQNGTGVMNIGSVYSSVDGGGGWGFGSNHLGPAHNLDAQVLGNSTPEGAIKVYLRNRATISQATVEVAEGYTLGFQSVIGKTQADGELRKLFYGGTENTNTDNLADSPTNNGRIGLGGWFAQSTQRSYANKLYIKALIIFDRVLNDEDTEDLKVILGGL